MHLVENESQIRKSLTTYQPSWPQLTRFDVLAACTIFVYSSDHSTVPPKVYKCLNGEGDTDIIEDPCFQAVRFYGFVFSWAGFVKGNLDLSGRHSSRCAFFSPLVHDFASDLSTIQALSGMTKLSPPDDSVWEKVCAKWLIPKGLDFSTVFGLAQQFFDDNGALAEPKFQELCLLDLPNELLDLCFRECDVSDARALSATCKHLKAVSLPYIYVVRLLGVLPANLTSLQRDALKSCSTEPKDSLSFHQALIRCVETLEFLFSRADITDRLRRVRLFDYYWCQDEDEYIPIYDSIRSMLCDVLQYCPNLTTLINRGFIIDEQFVDAIATLSDLHTIFLHGCAFSYPMDSHLPSYPYSLPQLRSVRHLTFLIDYHFISRHGILQFIYFCPDLVELIILREQERGVVYLPSRFSDFANLHHLQYLCVDGLHSDSIDGFKEWLIVLGSSTTSHPLSHVKVGLAHPQSDVDILHLVDVLDQYSIRSLYLDGLLEGTLPGLEALALLRRTGRRERWLCSWPEPVWEYASHFSNFTNLRSFGWNMPVLFDRITPKALVLFEGGEHGDSVLPYAGLSSREQDDELSEDDERHRMAVVFSAFIETLETISFCTSVGGIDWRIKRVDGQTNIEYVGLKDPDGPCWNPTWAKSLESSVMI
ncbi:hypothetical protein IW261DRAFT_1444677 [Armillaria novae-zelandiae]|uniref:F-box domain-containing protein n=1 Tax=Armillaria novae-zelandiae TaxID=153914 RepID=A0AA39PS52_9AGAR|nr:hypothetical protein IW261DRAFT_1444677 [Armillaria novae-zelandiae]